MKNNYTFMEAEIQDPTTKNSLKHSISTQEESFSATAQRDVMNGGAVEEVSKKSRWKWLFCKCSLDLLLKKKCNKVELMRSVYTGDMIDGENTNVVLQKICVQRDNKKNIDKNNNELQNKIGNYYLACSNKTQTSNPKMNKLVNWKVSLRSAKATNAKFNLVRCHSDSKLDNKVDMDNYNDVHRSNGKKYNFKEVLKEKQNELDEENKNVIKKRENPEIRNNNYKNFKPTSVAVTNHERQNKKLHEKDERQKLVLLKNHKNFQCIELKSEDVLKTSDTIASCSISSQTISSISSSSSSSPPSASSSPPSSTPSPPSSTSSPPSSTSSSSTTFFSSSTSSSLQPSSSAASSSASLVSLFLTSPSPLSTNTFSFLTFSASSPSAYSSSSSPSPIGLEDTEAKVSSSKDQIEPKKFHFNVDVANQGDGERNEGGDNRVNSDDGLKYNKKNKKNNNVPTNNKNNNVLIEKKNDNINVKRVKNYDENKTNCGDNYEDSTLKNNIESENNNQNDKQKVTKNQGSKKLKKRFYNKSLELGNQQKYFITAQDFQITSLDQTPPCSFCSRLTTSSSLDWSTQETDESGEEDSSGSAFRLERYMKSSSPQPTPWQQAAGGSIKHGSPSPNGQCSPHKLHYDHADFNNNTNVNKNNANAKKNINNNVENDINSDLNGEYLINEKNKMNRKHDKSNEAKAVDPGSNLEKVLITNSRSHPGNFVQINEKTDNICLNDADEMSFMNVSNHMQNLSCIHSFEDKVMENGEKDRKKKFQTNKNFFLSVENQKFQKNICFLNSYKINKNRKSDLKVSKSTDAVIDAYSVMNNTLNPSNNVPSDGNPSERQAPAKPEGGCDTPPQSKKDWKTMRTAGKQNELELILANVKNNKRQLISSDDSLLLTKKKVKRSIRRWFGSSTKLNKSFKKGLYLCSLVHQKGKLLLTCEDMLPSVQVACDQIPSIFTLKKHFNWLAKVVCNWEGVRTLKRTLQKSRHLNDCFEFRSKMLQALQNLKRAVALDDLGCLHYEMLIDNEIGSQVFLLMKSISEETKLSTPLRWHSINKLMRKRLNCILSSQNESISLPTAPSEGLSFTDRLIATLPEKIHVAKTYKTKLPPGLYIGYVRVTSFIDQLKILVPQNPPNVFPYIKIRNSSKVTKKEWDALVNLNSRKESTKSYKTTNCDENKLFALQVFKASNVLLKQLRVDKDEICRHRLYVKEMFELNQEVAFILLLPSAKEVCSGLGEEQRSYPGCINLPLHHFEIYQMQTYHTQLCQRYSHLSVLLEAESVVACQQMRETLAERHVKVGKEEKCIREHVKWLEEQQKHLDETWRSMRWVPEVINNARDCRLECSVQLY